MTYPESDFITLDVTPARAAARLAEQDAVRTALAAFHTALYADNPDAVGVAMRAIAPEYRDAIRPGLECMARDWFTGAGCDCGAQW
jgi:hypothetical protein